jgi:hypothetical protein
MQFPEQRDQSAEDAYVQHWIALDDPEGLADAVSEAVQRRRPQLALRLMGLLEDPAALEEGSPAQKLIGKARLYLVAPSGLAEERWEELAGMTGQLRDEIMARTRGRYRTRARTDAGDMLGLCRGPRRRRR